MIFTAIGVAISGGVLAGSAALGAGLATVASIGIAATVATLGVLSSKNSNAGTPGGTSPKYKFGALQTQADNTLCIPICYGVNKLAGNRNWQDTGTDTINTTIALCEGEITDISNIKINNHAIADLDPECTYSEYHGTSSQTIDDRVGISLTQAQRAAKVGGLKHIAYLAITARAGQKVSGTFMNVTCTVTNKKVKIYSGQDTYSTQYTNNPAWCIFDFLIGYSGCRLGYNSTGIFDNTLVKEYLDIQSFIDAAEYCREITSNSSAITGTVSTTAGSRTLTGSGTDFEADFSVGSYFIVNGESRQVVNITDANTATVDLAYENTASGQTATLGTPRFSLNIILDEKKSRLDWLHELLICCQGFMVYQNGKLSIKINKAETVSQVFTPSEIIAGSEKFWTTPRENLYDIVRIQYVNPAKESARIFASAELATFNNEQPIIQEVQAYGVTNHKQASRLAWFYLNLANTCNKHMYFETGKQGLDRTVGDVIQVTSTFMGYTLKRWRIVAMTEAQEGNIGFTCIEYNGPVNATYTTALTGTNNDLTYTSVAQTSGANNITITYLNPGAPSQSLSISVISNAITVNLATNGSSQITSTAALIKAAIEASVDATALVTLSYPTGNDGSGIVTAMTPQNLTGGNTGIYTDTLGSEEPVIDSVIELGNEIPTQRSVTKVVAANDSINKIGADYIVPDAAINAQDYINEAINSIPLKSIESGSVAGLSLTDLCAAMTSNTTPSGIVTASSVNATYSADLVPTMTSNTAPSGVASASSVYSASFAAWNAFDGSLVLNNGWVTVSGTNTGWLQYQFTSSKNIQRYTIQARDSANPTASPKDWTLKGSNNGTDWTTLDTQTNQTDWANLEKRTYSFTNNALYIYYRLDVSANNGFVTYLAIGEVEFMEKTYEAYKAFSDSNADASACWITASGTTAASITYQFGSGQTVTRYSITSRNDATQTVSPTAWKLYGSNNGSDWTELDSRSAITTWAQNETKIFGFTNAVSYTYYKLDITANNGHATLLAVGEIQFADASSSVLITFDSDSSTMDDYYNGLMLLFTSGDCSTEAAKLITDYIGSTKVATVNAFEGDIQVADIFGIQAYCGRVQLLEGTYTINGSIIVKSGVKLEGQGSGTIIKIADNISAITAIKDSVYQSNFVSISNLYFDGNKNNNGSTNHQGIYLYSSINSSISNTVFTKFKSKGINLNSSLNITLKNNISTNNDYGLYMNISTGGETILEYNKNSIISNNNFSQNSYGCSIVDISNCNIINNIIEENYWSGIVIGAGLIIGRSSNNKFVNNQINYNGTDGVYIATCDHIDIIGNSMVGNGTSANNTYSNLIIDADSNYANIQHNTSRSVATGNKPKYGIRINTADCDKNFVVNNDLKGVDAYGTAAYSDAGTSTNTTSSNRTS